MEEISVFLGIDTSNYTTSAALCTADGQVLLNHKVPLPVKEGERGLRQSDAVFHHVKNLPESAAAVGEYLRNNPNLAHGKIAAVVIQRDFGVTDPDIIQAVSYHTTGRPEMSLLEKIIYIADAIEPNRFYPGVDALRETAAEDLDRAVLQSLTNTINFVRGENRYLDEDTVLAKEYFEKIIKKGEKI